MNDSMPIQPTTEIAALVDQLNFYLRNVDFNFCMIMIIFPIGLILNGLQLFVFSKRALNLKTNMGSMHAILSFFNMLAIFFSIILTQLLPFLGIYIKNKSVFGCKLLSFLQRVSLDIPSFQQVLITFQFYMSIKFPLKFLTMQNSKKQYLFIVLSMITFAIVENIEYFFYDLLVRDSNLTNVNATKNSTRLNNYNVCHASFFLILGSGISSLIFRNFFPFIIMLIFNILIIFHVHKKQTKLNRTYRARGHRHFFISIMSINIIFFVLYLPWSIAQIIVYVQYFFTARSSQKIDPNVLYFYNIGWSISYLNYIFPFFVYYNCNRLFRRELFLIIKYVSKEKNISTFEPRTTPKSRTTTKVKPEPEQSNQEKSDFTNYRVTTALPRQYSNEVEKF